MVFFGFWVCDWLPIFKATFIASHPRAIGEHSGFVLLNCVADARSFCLPLQQIIAGLGRNIDDCVVLVMGVKCRTGEGKARRGRPTGIGERQVDADGTGEA